MVIFVAVVVVLIVVVVVVVEVVVDVVVDVVVSAKEIAKRKISKVLIIFFDRTEANFLNGKLSTVATIEMIECGCFFSRLILLSGIRIFDE